MSTYERPTANERKSSSTHGERRGLWLVLHLNPKKRGSQEQQLVALAARMRTRGTPLTYVFSARPPAWLAAEMRAHAVDLRTLDYSRPVAAAATLYRWLRAARPALLHYHFLRASSPEVLAGCASGARVMVNDHVTLTRASDSRAYEAAKHLRDRLVNPHIALRLAVSSFVARSVEDVEHVDPRRIEVVENGIDVERFARADGSGIREELGASSVPLIVCVSRLSREKGVFSAVRMMVHLQKTFGASAQKSVLALVGDGPEEAALRALAAELGVADRVRFLGLRNDVERLLAACDVSVVPSEWDEAFGQAVAESMAAARAVVVTRSGAMPDLVGDTGLVVPKRDPETMAAAVARLIADDGLRARLGRAAQARARHRFDLPRWVDRMMDVYARELQAAGAPLEPQQAFGALASNV